MGEKGFQFKIRFWRQHYPERDEFVAMAIAPRNASSLQAQDFTSIRSLRHRQDDGPPWRGRSDFRPEDGFRQRDGQVEMNVVALPGKELVRID